MQIWKILATSSLLAEEFTDNLENVRMLYKVSSQYAKSPDELESVWMNWKVSGRCKKCLDNLENVSG